MSRAAATRLSPKVSGAQLPTAAGKPAWISCG